MKNLLLATALIFFCQLSKSQTLNYVNEDYNTTHKVDNITVCMGKDKITFLKTSPGEKVITMYAQSVVNNLGYSLYKFVSFPYQIISSPGPNPKYLMLTDGKLEKFYILDSNVFKSPRSNTDEKLALRLMAKGQL
jgi:hypothetical protein